MSTERWQRVRSAFEEVCVLADDEREAALERLLADDPEARDEVQDLLRADAAEREDFLEPPACVTAGVPESLAGTQIGGCRIVRPIATGGMGTVFEAHQDRPQRRVALKMMNPGLLSPSALKRFHWESEVLAHLRHSGIAQVYDAGVHRTSLGVEAPYFSMEYIEDARDIVTHAREAELDTHRVLDLFLEVAEAVHFAHGKGVIHRDLKPANVLVGKDGHPKVIDFGVARAERAGEGGFATQTGEIVGTLRHMSPEQLSGDPRTVDVRSDVYALGLLLYELVTGRQPYELRDLSMSAAARVVQETPPAPPSEAPAEVGWIVLRALEKEPARRYASVADLARDIARYLAHEPIEAGPPSGIYRARKFLRRHWLPVGAASIVLASLIAGVVLSTLHSVQAATEAEKFGRINRVLTHTLASVLPEEGGRDARVVDLLDRLAGEIESEVERPAVAASLHGTLGRCYLGLGLYEEALRQAELALWHWEGDRPTDPLEHVEVLDTLLQAEIELDRDDDAATTLDRGRAAALEAFGPDAEETLRFDLRAASIDLRRSNLEDARERVTATRVRAHELFGPEAPISLASLELEVDVLRNTSDLEEAAEQAQRLVEVRRRVNGDQSSFTLQARVRLARIERDRGRLDEAETLLVPAIRDMISIFGEDHDRVLSAMNDLAVVYCESKQWARAEDLIALALEPLEARYGPGHSQVLLLRRNLEATRSMQGYSPTSEASMRAVYESTLALFGPDHVRTLGAERSLAFLLVQLGELEEAESHAARALEVARRVLAPDHVLTLHCLATQADLYFQRGAYGDAVPLLEEALAGYVRRLGADSTDARQAAANLGASLTALGRWRDATPVLAESLRAHRAVLDPDDPALLVMTINLGEALLRAKDLAQAEAVLREGIEHGEQYLPEGDPMTRHCVGVLARVLGAAGRTGDAADLFAEIFEGRPVETELPPIVHVNLRLEYGIRLMELEVFENAEEQLTIAFEDARSTWGATDPTYRVVVQWLVELQVRWGRPEEAARWRLELEGEGD